MKIESIAPDDRDVPKGDVVGNARLIQHLLAGPFVDASRTRTGTTQAGGVVACLGIIRPLDRDLGVVLFDYLNWF